MKVSEGVRRLALLLGSIGSTVWLIFVTIDTKFFTRIQPSEWLLLGLIAGICFLIPFLLVHGIAWVIRGFREDLRHRPTERTTLTEKENGENEIQMNVAPSQNFQEEKPLTMREEGYGYNELEIMKEQFVSLLRGAPLRYLIVCGILAILILLEFLLSGCTTVQKIPS